MQPKQIIPNMLLSSVCVKVFILNAENCYY